MKKLAAAADARWASKGSFLQHPSKQKSTAAALLQPSRGVLEQINRDKGEAEQNVHAEKHGAQSTSQQEAQMQDNTSDKPKESPWDRGQKRGEDEPAPWIPSTAARR